MNTLDIYLLIYYGIWYLIVQLITVDPPVVTVGEVGPTSVMLSWEAQPGVTHYNISFERSPAEGSRHRQTQCAGVTHEDTIDVGNVTEHTLNSLEEDSKYTINVTAVYTGGSASSVPSVNTTQQDGNFKECTT